MRIGIDLGGTKIAGIALAENGKIICRRRSPTPQGDYPATIKTIQTMVADLEKEAGKAHSVGIGTPGALNPTTGTIKNANSTCLIGHPLQADLAQTLGRSVKLANDADCFTLSEATDGAAAGAKTVFGVILGTGVGGGVVINGQLLQGPNAIVGEWGHNPLPWPRPDELPGPDCYCGKQGCIESFCSGPGVVRDYGQPAIKTVQEIVTSAEDGNEQAKITLQRHCDRLARALAVVVNILDPEVIVMGGGLSNLTHLYEDIPKIWGRYIFSDSVLTRLLPPKFGDSSGVRGAAWLT